MNYRTHRPGFLGRSFFVAPALVALGMSFVGCLDRPIEVVEPRNTTTVVELLPQSRVDKIDLLLAIDNSRSMADKQEILASAVPDLVRGLANPRCLKDDGTPVEAAQQPAGPIADCPLGSRREFEPVLDIHIGIVSSSLGDHGAVDGFCKDVDENEKTCTDAAINHTRNDHGQLVARKNACAAMAPVPTYGDKGFLAWDPGKKLSPVGESNLGTIDGTEGLVPRLAEMVKGVGQIGCGYESQLESIYRFLVDPAPYKSIDASSGIAKVSGVDEMLLAQRAEFLRPDSLVAILMLTDENDCSIKETGFFPRVSGGRRLPRARAICATNPDDKCCTSCDLTAPAECGEDPTCTGQDGKRAFLTSKEDSPNLRCFDQKRRFGVDFLYPTQRYVDAFKQPRIANREGELVANPLYPEIDLDKGILNVRTPDLVFFAGVVGVPWQDIARDPSNLEKGFKSASEMGSDGTWDMILGDRATRKAPTDRLMLETTEIRVGKHPITGEPLDDTPATPLGNSINGHEWGTKGSDLQYACIFDVPTAQDCSTDITCECNDLANANPLCDAVNPQSRVRAKAYPGARHLEVIKGLGTQGIVASVCPAQVDDPSQEDYGYRPAIGALVDRLKDALKTPCLPRTLEANDKGQVNCLVLEARATGGACSCNPDQARLPVANINSAAVDEAMKLELASRAQWDCFCALPQLEGEGLTVCQNDASDTPVDAAGEPVSGFCYVDATTEPMTGNEALVSDCSETQRRRIRVVGKGEPVSGGTLIITCSGE
jgi:hypothetical protein